jgi:hypothetical protein
MIGQHVSVAIHHTGRNYSPHPTPWSEAANQLSIFLFASGASGKSDFYFPISDARGSWEITLSKRYANFLLTHHATRQAESKGSF